MDNENVSPGKTLLAYLQSLSADLDADFLRESLRTLMQLLMELEVSALIEANPYERKDSRRAYRNGYRRRTVRTGLGEIELDIPKLRKGTYYPSFIESLPQTERVFLALIQDACVQGVSMDSVETVLHGLGIEPIHKSQVADICAQLDDMIYEFRQRPLDAVYPRLWLNVLKLNAGQPRPLSVVVAVGVRENGQREVVGFEVTPDAEDREFWSAFLRSLTDRGLAGIEQVTADAYEGLRPAVRDVFGGVEWKPRSDHLAYGYDSPALVSAVSTLLVDANLPSASDLHSTRAQQATGALMLTRLVGALLLEVHAAWQQEFFPFSTARTWRRHVPTKTFETLL